MNYGNLSCIVLVVGCRILLGLVIVCTRISGWIGRTGGLPLSGVSRLPVESLESFFGCELLCSRLCQGAARAILDVGNYEQDCQHQVTKRIK